MSDLVKRLRIGALRCVGGPHSPEGSVMRECADEIERLRAEVHAWELKNAHNVGLADKELSAVRAERDALRAVEQDMAIIIRRLALALRKAQPEHSTVSDAAMEFLRKRGLDGEVLR